MKHLLHSENVRYLSLSSKRIFRWLENRCTVVAKETKNAIDPSVSIVIRTRNDDQHLQRLLQDIKEQVYDGQIEIIIVDTESRDRTLQYARRAKAKIISLQQKDFNYPRALNVGFAVARHQWVVTLVGHSSLTNRYMLKALTYWSERYEHLAGIYSIPLPNWNASWLERHENAIRPTFWKDPQMITGRALGLMGANCSIVKRSVWEALGGYDERYAGGGEDLALALSMLDNGLTIMREPLCSVYHSHGLSLRNGVRQWLHWMEVGKKATAFNTRQVHTRRPDLR
jgi:O-antigen biosynthesis protein